MKIRIANGAGFLGDNLDAPRRLVESAEIDYLTLEYLAELTLAILARSREKNPNAGYATDFLDVARSLCPALADQSQLRIVTNAGGVNPQTCARDVARILCDAGMENESLGIVTGDDLLPRIRQLQADGCSLENLETGETISELGEPITCANAYLGARPIVDAISGGARIVVTGRVADASLTVGPALHKFNWAWDDWNRLAAASVAGHLIECGAQVTGGYATQWQVLNLSEVGYPIVELVRDGGIVITKPDGTGGVVNRRTVVEQLVYEIGDPRHYKTPDVDVDFTTVEVDDLGSDRVAVHKATGRPAPDQYKVSLSYRSGYMASGQLVVSGKECLDKARACAAMVFERVERAGYVLAQTNVELLGAGDAIPDFDAQKCDAREVVLRLTAQDPRREAVERFTKEIAPLITSGPAGLAGYAAGRSTVRPVFTFWPALVPKEFVTADVEVRTAKDWCAKS